MPGSDEDMEDGTCIVSMHEILKDLKDKNDDDYPLIFRTVK